MMNRRMTRRSILRLAPGLLVVPALAPSLVRAAQAATPAVASPVASPAATPVATPQAVLDAGVTQGLPGVALAVDRAGSTLFSGAAGVANIERQTPLKATDRFRIYSIAKTFTATVVLQLVDEGVLTLDDTVTKWLDEPVVSQIPHVERITLRQLLNHTSGIYDYADDTDSPFWADAFLGPNADWTKVWTIEELLGYAAGAKHPPYFAPGAGNHYSNTNYLLLGLVVEAATGRRYGDELRERILTPLALHDTFLAEGGAMPEGTVTGYQLLDGELVDVSVSNLSLVWTAGGMVSTTADLVRFGRAVFDGELLSPASFKEMFAFVPAMNPANGEGMGVYRVQTPNGELIGMDGGSAGGTSNLMRLATADITVAVLANMSPDEGLVEGMRDEVIAWAVAQAAGTTAASVAPIG